MAFVSYKHLFTCLTSQMHCTTGTSDSNLECLLMMIEVTLGFIAIKLTKISIDI